MGLISIAAALRVAYSCHRGFGYRLGTGGAGDIVDFNSFSILVIFCCTAFLYNDIVVIGITEAISFSYWYTNFNPPDRVNVGGEFE
jgi:hypothetical protein